jgi:hypothetical protein
MTDNSYKILAESIKEMAGTYIIERFPHIKHNLSVTMSEGTIKEEKYVIEISHIDDHSPAIYGVIFVEESLIYFRGYNYLYEEPDALARFERALASWVSHG